MKEIVKYSLMCARNETDDPDLKKFLTRLIEEKALTDCLFTKLVTTGSLMVEVIENSFLF